MRSSIVFLKYGRVPQNENKVPFKMMLPLALRDRVSGKGLHNKEQGCLYEISLLLNCLDQNGNEDKMCMKEAQNFQSCYKTFLKNKKFGKEQALKGTLTPNAKNLKYKQINQLLAKYPLP
ncbi:hypothetical protein HCN44_011424 [Aphidius gifuensis]|uniref:Uncharacterized protein n=1 Tax=Aphidius gifuensis TaxID=684658 RepID=A0A834XVF1_APHGI|nr:uncharacterized protein LOC122851538 [Aphidius gifuensis]XP_044006760.1 uncharacterized protein LOC122851538 [Aphidius gifuensis]KAF7994155.1 hypothetical protein HCN44_011424 [Aphidius gifuensis]